MTFRLKWPTKSRTVTQNFLANPDVYTKFGLPGHEGLDIGIKNGDDIYAAADGVVNMVETNPSVHNYGIHIRLDHNVPEGQFQTTYAHLKEAKVIAGQNVKAGDLIGLGDTTGNSTGPHLHLNLKLRGASAAGFTQFINGAGKQVTMPNDLLDPSPFLDPQPPNFPVRPVKADHPSASLLPGGSQPIQPTDNTSQLAQNGFSIVFQVGGQLRIIPITGAITIMLEGIPPLLSDPNLTALETGGFQLRLPKDVVLTIPSLPWLGIAMRVSSKIGLRVRETPTTNGKEVTRLPEGIVLTLSPATTNADSFIWRQIIAPEKYLDTKIKDFWMAEKSLDGKQIFLLNA